MLPGNYFIQLLIITLLAMGLDAFVCWLMDTNLIPLLFILAPAHACVTALQHVYLAKEGIKDNAFIRRYMGINTLKLFLYLIIIVLVFIRWKDVAVAFIIRFMVQYFLYLVFETAALYKASNTKTR